MDPQSMDGPLIKGEKTGVGPPPPPPQQHRCERGPTNQRIANSQGQTTINIGIFVMLWALLAMKEALF